MPLTMHVGLQLLALLLLCLAALQPAIAAGFPRSFVAKLNGSLAGVPSSHAIASATIQVLSGTSAILSFEVDMIHDITLVQLHTASPPASGPAVLTVYKPTLNNQQQPVTGHFKTAKGSVIPFDPSQNNLIALLAQQQVYMDVQTLTYPAGEIRGFFAPVNKA